MHYRSLSVFRNVMGSFILLILIPQQSLAQLPVIDAANLLNTSLISIQTYLEVIHGVTNLTGMDDALAGGTFSQDLELLYGLTAEASGLSWDFEQLQARTQLLYALETAPRSAAELQLRQQQLDQVVLEGYIGAARTQMLMKNMARSVAQIQRIYDMIGGLIGNLQGQQHIATALTKLQQTQTEHAAVTTAWARAQTADRMQEPVLRQGIRNINEAIMADHPK